MKCAPEGFGFRLGDVRAVEVDRRVGQEVAAALVRDRLRGETPPDVRRDLAGLLTGLGTAWLPHAGSAGFPSSHASVAFAFAVAVAMQTPRRIGAWAALAMATLIAWSRISLGLHFPFDVAAGAVLGTVCGWAVVRLVMPRADPSLQPTPAAPHP